MSIIDLDARVNHMQAELGLSDKKSERARRPTLATQLEDGCGGERRMRMVEQWYEGDEEIAGVCQE
jgi:hypothetical protein